MFFKTRKIINDPVYGIVNLPDGILFNIFEHKYFQRLRRISQLGLSSLVYPGAIHTRFHHALGALHLCLETLEMFQRRRITITSEDKTGVALAVLLHDIGHGPFSHVLEHTITGAHHEELTLAIMHRLNDEYKGQLDTAIEIFTGSHPKHFLHQLVSGQLDLDRMDYLNRDSFFTGVAEGKIGYDRIIKMMTVVDNQLAIEEKGIYSVENFLMARRLMYWQVYLHKTVLASEQMLIRCLKQAALRHREGEQFHIAPALAYFMNAPHSSDITEEMLNNYLLLDDYDLWWALKQYAQSDDKALSYLAKSILNRKIFAIQLSNQPFTADIIQEKIALTQQKLNIPESTASTLVFNGMESNEIYHTRTDEIMVLQKNGAIKPFSEVSDYPIYNQPVKKYFVCYPKLSYIA